MILKYFAYGVVYGVFILGMVLSAILVALLVRELYFFILHKKMDNDYRNRIRILHAICGYNLALIKNDYGNYKIKRIPYSVLEHPKNTIYYFWDWGYKHLVDRDTYSKIKPYIKK